MYPHLEIDNIETKCESFLSADEVDALIKEMKEKVKTPVYTGYHGKHNQGHHNSYSVSYSYMDDYPEDEYTQWRKDIRQNDNGVVKIVEPDKNVTSLFQSKRCYRIEEIPTAKLAEIKEELLSMKVQTTKKNILIVYNNMLSKGETKCITN